MMFSLMPVSGFASNCYRNSREEARQPSRIKVLVVVCPANSVFTEAPVYVLHGAGYSTGYLKICAPPNPGHLWRLNRALTNESDPIDNDQALDHYSSFSSFSSSSSSFYACPSSIIDFPVDSLFSEVLNLTKALEKLPTLNVDIMPRNPTNWNEYQYGTSRSDSLSSDRSVHFHEEEGSPSATSAHLEIPHGEEQESVHDLRRRRQDLRLSHHSQTY